MNDDDDDEHLRKRGNREAHWLGTHKATLSRALRRILEDDTIAAIRDNPKLHDDELAEMLALSPATVAAVRWMFSYGGWGARH